MVRFIPMGNISMGGNGGLPQQQGSAMTQFMNDLNGTVGNALSVPGGGSVVDWAQGLVMQQQMRKAGLGGMMNQTGTMGSSGGFFQNNVTSQTSLQSGGNVQFVPLARLSGTDTKNDTDKDDNKTHYKKDDKAYKGNRKDKYDNGSELEEELGKILSLFGLLFQEMAKLAKDGKLEEALKDLKGSGKKDNNKGY